MLPKDAINENQNPERSGDFLVPEAVHAKGRQESRPYRLITRSWKASMP